MAALSITLAASSFTLAYARILRNLCEYLYKINGNDSTGSGIQTNDWTLTLPSAPFWRVTCLRKMSLARSNPRRQHKPGVTILVRHQTADWGCCKEVTRHTAKEPFAEAAMPISASDEQVRALLLREVDQLNCTRPLLV